MKNKMYIVMVLLVCVSLLLTACNSRKITVTNSGNVNYCELYVSKSGEDAYGANQLPSGQTVTPGNTYDISISEAGNYDVKIVACDGAGEQVLQVNVP